jgi:hypothetical protein
LTDQWAKVFVDLHADAVRQEGMLWFFGQAKEKKRSLCRWISFILIRIINPHQLGDFLAESGLVDNKKWVSGGGYFFG